MDGAVWRGPAPVVEIDLLSILGVGNGRIRFHYLNIIDCGISKVIRGDFILSNCLGFYKNLNVMTTPPFAEEKSVTYSQNRWLQLRTEIGRITG